ncbi:MAG: MmcQ/YjbR family DNA-binding protein [Pseudomonadota bacterium]
MTYDEYNDFCRSLTATFYVVQWGGSHVWKVGDKVFAVGGWEKSGTPAFSFKTSELNFEILKEEPGYRPAPYLAARGMKWIQRYGPSCGDNSEIKNHLESSYRMVASSLTKKKQKELGLSV